MMDRGRRCFSGGVSKCLSKSSMRHEAAEVGDGGIYSVERAVGILLVLAGMTLQWSALHSITFAGTILHMGGMAGSDKVWIVNSAFTFLVFFALFLTSKRVCPLVAHRNVFRLISLCIAIGVVCFLAGSLLSLEGLLCAGSALLACGMTPLIVAWGEMYVYLNPKGEQLLVTLGAVVFSVMLYAIEIDLPQVLAIALFAVMPIGSVLCLLKAQSLFEASSQVWGVRAETSMKKSPALFLICIVALSIPYNYLRSGSEVQGALLDVTQWASVMSVAIVIMVVVALAEGIAERKGVLLVPSAVLLLQSVAMAAHLSVAPQSSLLVPSFLYAGYYLFLAMVYLALGPIVATANTNSTRLFSSAMIANVGGLLLGAILGNLDAWMSNQAVAVVVMVVTYLIFFLGIILLSSRSCSIFRVNNFDEDAYSFECLVPIAAATEEKGGSQAAFSGLEGTPSMLDAIVVQCAAVAEVHGLSAREHEVLVELTRGKTIASIAEDLVLSDNTIKAHTKAIYRKLEVHTREELLAFVENTSIS